MPACDYTTAYLDEVRELASQLDPAVIDRMIDLLLEIRAQAAGSSFLALAGAPVMPATRSMIFARLRA